MQAIRSLNPSVVTEIFNPNKSWVHDTFAVWNLARNRGISTTNVITALEDFGENLIKWLKDNQMKRNTDECHVLLNIQVPNTRAVTQSR